MTSTIETCKKGHSRADLFRADSRGYFSCRICNNERAGLTRLKNGKVKKSKYVGDYDQRSGERIAKLQTEIREAQEELLIREKLAKIQAEMREAQEELSAHKAKLRKGN
tara:strand:+ start:452 stop:778 length:327 start_codon:yes stop_codon:yes gene_type:complete